ncbi:MAG: GHMP kinase [Anaerolineae bacterium UTCFX2]|jgi:D-glycero-alpha-D-manno-heptose-7-phosphate kinase|nr:GHMP kinase [Anaerolineales bacterium]OQY93938.1 MAG: GHMP kinase [Anaerolineae bacterium UTCFX2]
MIITQTPLRVSLLGGGTDFPSFIREEGGGNVLSTAIDKYIFVTIRKRFDDNIRLGYTRTEIVENIDELQHDLIREAFRMTGLHTGIELTTIGDLPAGAGLGSSSAVTVGSLYAMYTYLGKIVPAELLAKEACAIEIDVLNKPIGIQDQYICALGGLRFIEFHPDGKVLHERINLEPRLQQRLNESLLLFYTGVTRQAETILGEQKDHIRQSRLLLNEIKHMACAAKEELLAGNLDVIGQLLHESWKLKKQLASRISNPTIDAIYETALKAGALGGKISGAGGGGFLLIYCPFEKREQVRDALLPLKEVHFNLENDGSKVIFNIRR